jgi:hypothetical protein
VVLVAAAAPCQAQTLEKISIVIFSAPSLGAFMPPVIKARKLDQANGLDISFQERTPDAYTAQFNSGEFKVGGSASLLTVGLADSRGVKVKVSLQPVRFLGRGRDRRGRRSRRSRISKASSSPAPAPPPTT